MFFEIMPTEVKVKIFDNLQYSDHKNCRLVSKEWKHIVDSQYFYTNSRLTISEDETLDERTLEIMSSDIIKRIEEINVRNVSHEYFSKMNRMLVESEDLEIEDLVTIINRSNIGKHLTKVIFKEEEESNETFDIELSLRTLSFSQDTCDITSVRSEDEPSNSCLINFY